MRIITTLLLAIGLCVTMQAQQVEKCGYQTRIDELNQQYPGYQNALDKMLRDAVIQSRKEAIHAGDKGVTGTKIFRIPVVVHIVYTNSDENIDDSLVYSQIDVLNEAYRRNDGDTANIRNEFRNLAADVGIEFYLADTDPNGQPTNGITRTQGTKPPLLGFSTSDEVKATSTGGIDPWPTNRYLNIWVCDLLSGFGLLGYAYPPPVNLPSWPANSAPADTNFQGVVIYYKVFGRNNPLAVNDPLLNVADGGKSCVHEVGHFLGLRHIWGDGGNPLLGTSGTCAEDDYINDTPEAKDASQQTCNFNANSCPSVCSVGPDYPDMIENYMDYSEDQCLMMFTWEQARTMRYILENYRSQLGNVTTGQIKGPLLPDGSPTQTIVSASDSYTYYIGSPYYNFNGWNSVLIPGDTLFDANGTPMVLDLCDSITIMPGQYYTTPEGIVVGVEEGDTVDTYSDGSIVLKQRQLTGINAPELQADLGIYPNPTVGQFTISLKGQYEMSNLKVMNLLGETMLDIDGALAPGQNKLVESDLPSGVYLLTGTMNGQLVSRKLMVY